MGRFFVRLDPPGYKFCSEPGLCFLIDGATLLQKFAPDAANTARPAHNFYVPPGSEWLMCKPLQFRPDWHQSAQLVDYVLRAERWLFQLGVTATEWEPTRVPGTTYPDNQWISLIVDEGATSLDSADYDALGTAAGINLPTGLITVGICHTTPEGADFGSVASHVTPYLQWLTYPAPDECFVFGFSNLALVVFKGVTYVLRDRDGGRQRWELLAKGQLKGKQQAFAGVPSQGSGSLLQGVSPRADVQQILALVAGFTDLFLLSSESEGVAVPLKTAKPDQAHQTAPVTPDTPLLPAGPLWVAAVPGRRLAFQAQLVGFEAADSRDLNEPTPLVWIDLTEEYKPSVAPAFSQDGYVWSDPTQAEDATSSNPGVSSVQLTNSDTGTTLEYGLLNEAGEAWDTETATTYKGSLYLYLEPGFRAGFDAAYLSPQVRCIEFRFAPVLTDRQATTLSLTDEQFAGVEVECHLYRPEDKRLYIDFFDSQLETLSASGIDQRDNFPVEVWEDMNDDNVADTVRAAGWVESFELKEHFIPADDGPPIRAYRLEAKGLLSRAERQWEYLPQLVNPEADPPGTIEHSFAVRECLLQSGFDVDDANVYVVQADPYAGTDFAQLKGTWGLTSGSVGRPVGNAWGPSWKDTRLEYAARIAHEKRGWVLYEGLSGRLLYHEDLWRDLQRGAFYTVSATLWRSSQAAEDNAGDRRQKYLAAPTRTTRKPEANVIRVSASDESSALTPQMLIRDRLSISDKDYAHFVGEPIVYALEPKDATDPAAMRVLGWLMLEKLGRRAHLWQPEAPLAPWETQPEALNLGHVVTLDGKGNYLIIHLHWNLLTSRAAGGQSQTRFTCLSLPDGATQGAGGGDYPGQGTDPTEEPEE